jgi:DNA-binding NtrC family response regulator
VRRVLTEENFDVETTLNSKTGLGLGLDNVYDIVLTDIRIPELDGISVLLDIRAAKPSTPVVIITGYATLRSAVDAMKFGAADYIQKPFTPEQLTSCVTAAIGAAANMEDGAAAGSFRDPAEPPID